MKKTNWVSAFALVSQLGFSMITPILICTLIGVFLDDVTGMEPLWVIIWILLGVGAAFRNLFYMTGKELKKNEKNEHHNDRL